MPKSMFDLDDDLIETNKKDYLDLLKKARALCIRGQYDRALEIYNQILDEDYENEDALIGILRVHSEDFQIFDSKEINNDIHAIEKMCPDTSNEEYLDYLSRRKKNVKTEDPKKGTDSKEKSKTSNKKTDITSKVKPYEREGQYIYFGRFPYTKYEDSTIVWKIIKEEKDKALILAVEHSMGYLDDCMRRFDIKSNRYDKSFIRSFLNEEFYNKAFNEEEKEIIIETIIDNSIASTGYDSFDYDYKCVNTKDKLFLPSYKEIESMLDYGDIDDEDFKSNFYWWLRTPDESFEDLVSCINDLGEYGTIDIDDLGVAVRPACWIKL
ncbi:MAG: tetratricopeptide repeat protein [Acholeplasmatales bacterium]|nr:tetratricopeptide repeat protein [Acholeplasmatales bacterium]